MLHRSLQQRLLGNVVPVCSIIGKGNVRRALFGLFVVLIVVILGLRVGDDHHLAENLVQLVATRLLVSSPLDQDVKAHGFYGLSSIDIRSLT